MTTEHFLTLAAAGAIVTTFGSLLALVIKDFFLIRYFDDRRERRALDTIYKKYKDPIVLSATELSSRLVEILRGYPTVYLSSVVMMSKPSGVQDTTTNDPHYRKYKFLSTLYRLCSFFGWLELYRQEITFISSSDDKSYCLEKCLYDIKYTFANGYLNTNEDWKKWKDALIFREEQRGIGERMIVISDSTKTIMGYVKFTELAQSYIDSQQNEWLQPAFNFVLNMQPEADFRKQRLEKLLPHFMELMELIDSKKANQVIKEIIAYQTTSLTAPGL